MARQPSFPHIRTNILDKSATAVLNPIPMPLHRPMYFIRASQGPIGEPIWGPYADQAQLFGDDTFTEGSPYYNHQTLFALRAMQYQPVYIVRLAEASAKTAGLVLVADVEQVDLTQYERDALGNWKKDGSGALIPQKMPDGTTVVTEPGVKITFRRRPLAANEKYNQLLPETVGQITSYPILATTGTYVGSGGNKGGFKLYHSGDADKSAQSAIGALTLRFAPMSMSTGAELPIRDVFSNPYTEVTFKPNAIDATTQSRYDLEEVLRRDYYYSTNDGVKRSKLPFQVKAYSQYVKIIADLVLAKSPELTGLDPWLVNIFTAKDADGLPYDHLAVDPASLTVLNELVVNYNQGGSDGDLSDEAFNDTVEAFLTGEVNELIGDQARYSVNHLYDSGFPLATKIAMLKIWGLRDDIKIVFTTQDVANPANTKQEDNSTGTSLRAAILLHPESLLYGTQAVRADIYQQAGYLNTSTAYRPLVPCSLDAMEKRCAYEGAVYVKGVPRGRPNSEVTIFDPASISWSPTTADHKQLSWDNGLNYLQYADSSTLFYADQRSVYPLDTSLLSDGVLCSWLVYLKQIAFEIWTIYAGRTDDVESLSDEISSEIDKKVVYAFSGRLQTTTKVYQTETDKALGYQYTVEISVKANMPNRVMNVLIPVSRKDA